MHSHLFFFGMGTSPEKSRSGRRWRQATRRSSPGRWLAMCRGCGSRARASSRRACRSLARPALGSRTTSTRIKQHIAEQNLKIALTPQDVDRAVAGEPHVVLAVEGATFVEDDPKPLERAYELGVRSVQLVHYIENPLGDFQTEAPQHDGLTDARP